MIQEKIQRPKAMTIYKPVNDSLKYIGKEAIRETAGFIPEFGEVVGGVLGAGVGEIVGPEGVPAGSYIGAKIGKSQGEKARKRINKMIK